MFKKKETTIQKISNKLTKSDRFKVIYSELAMVIIRDSVTGVNYIQPSLVAGGGAMTPLLDSNGKVTIN